VFIICKHIFICRLQLLSDYYNFLTVRYNEVLLYIHCRTHNRYTEEELGMRSISGLKLDILYFKKLKSLMVIWNFPSQYFMKKILYTDKDYIYHTLLRTKFKYIFEQYHKAQNPSNYWVSIGHISHIPYRFTSLTFGLQQACPGSRVSLGEYQVRSTYVSNRHGERRSVWMCAWTQSEWDYRSRTMYNHCSSDISKSCSPTQWTYLASFLCN
jgi:hypothetical protein